MTIAPALDDPVRAALHGAAHLHDTAVRVGAVADGDWAGYLELISPAGIGRFLAAGAAYCGGCPTREARTAAATLLLGDAAAALAAPIGALLVGQRRGLVINPADVFLQLGSDGVESVAIGAPSLYVLGDDPLAGYPGSRHVADLAALRRTVAAGYANLLTPMLTAVHHAVRRGRRALWAEATERLAYAVFASLRHRNAAHRAPAEVAELLAVAPPELRHPVRWVRTLSNCGARTGKARSICCLAYQTPRWRGDRCATCPGTPGRGAPPPDGMG